MTFDRQPTLDGQLVIVRPMDVADFESLYAVGADPLIWEQHPEPGRFLEDNFRAFFAGHLASDGALTVLDRQGGQIIGASRYDYLDEKQSEVEIGWTFLARHYWGGAHNADLKHVMLTHAFHTLRTVVFLVGEGNRRSRRAVEKLGAVETGMQRGQIRYALTEARYADARTGT